MPGPLRPKPPRFSLSKFQRAARGLRAVHQDAGAGGAFRDRRTPCAAWPSRPPIRQSRRASRGSGVSSQASSAIPASRQTRLTSSRTRYSPGSHTRSRDGRERAQTRGETLGERRRRCVIEVDVVERPALRRDLGGEVAHCREEHRDARLGAPDVGRFAGRLDHQHAVARRIEAGEGGIVESELVAEDEDHPARSADHVARRVHRGALRQRSEQYFTSSQVFAQRLRHTMGRPHATQGRDGRCGLRCVMR